MHGLNGDIREGVVAGGYGIDAHSDLRRRPWVGHTGDAVVDRLEKALQFRSGCVREGNGVTVTLRLAQWIGNGDKEFDGIVAHEKRGRDGDLISRDRLVYWIRWPARHELPCIGQFKLQRGVGWRDLRGFEKIDGLKCFGDLGAADVACPTDDCIDPLIED